MHNWETDPRGISECLIDWEAQHGWSGAEAARQLGAPYLTYRDWRGGRRKPSPELMLRKLMRAIDLITKLAPN